MRPNFRGMFVDLKTKMGFETPTPAQFGKTIEKSIAELEKLRENLIKNFPQDETVKISEFNIKWAYEGDNPIGALAGGDAEKIINPKKFILVEIEKIKKSIEKMRKKMENDPNSQTIVGKWDSIWLYNNLAEMNLYEFLNVLKIFAYKLKSE